MWRGLKRSLITKAEYYQNSLLSAHSKTFHREQLRIPESIKGIDGLQVDKVVLFSTPQGEQKPDPDPYWTAIEEFNPETVFVQEDPMTYIQSQRKIERNITKDKIDSFSAKMLTPIDHPVPKSPSEVLLNIMQLKLIKQIPLASQVPDELESSPEDIVKTMTDDLLNYVFGRDTMYPYLSQVVLSGVVDREAVVLGDMPEQLLRQRVANTLSLSELVGIRDKMIEELNLHYETDPGKLVSMRDIIDLHFSEVFSYPRDYYMTSLLKESAKDTKGLVAFVAAPHMYPIMKLWPTETSFVEACRIPNQLPSDSTEILIEKHALLDFILETALWEEPNTINPFPYLGQLDEIKEDLPYMKAYFLKQYNRHMEVAKDKILLPASIEFELDELIEEEKRRKAEEEAKSQDS